MRVVEFIQNKCIQKHKVLVAYLSMGFGNPYGDAYDVGIVEKFSENLAVLGIKIISLADTIGVSQPDQINYLFKTLSTRFPTIEFGAHLHSNPATSIKKIKAAFTSGCQRFDGAIKGFGGCPMAEDKLVGNLATETILHFLAGHSSMPDINQHEFAQALTIADEIFSNV